MDESDLHSAELLNNYQATQSAHQSASTNPSPQSARDKNKWTNGRRCSQRHSSTIRTMYSDDLDSSADAHSSLHTPHRHLKLEVLSESPSSSNPPSPIQLQVQTWPSTPPLPIPSPEQCWSIPR